MTLEEVKRRVQHIAMIRGGGEVRDQNFGNGIYLRVLPGKFDVTVTVIEEALDARLIRVRDSFQQLRTADGTDVYVIRGEDVQYAVFPTTEAS